MPKSNESSPYYITTAIPYVNAAPHVGFALELVQADVLARFHRLLGQDVHFVSGTDDNSLKNVRAATEEGIPVADFVRSRTAQFHALHEILDLSYDDFVATSADPRHALTVRELWSACRRRGDLYRGRYSGLYCVGCEHFLREGELDPHGHCPEHREPPEAIDEENYFFRLSRYTDELHRLIACGELAIEPEHIRAEVLAFIERGLEDFSVSRSRGRAAHWGLDVPGDPTQVIYVWFDALGNYLSALDYGTKGARYQRYWEGPSRRTHVIGKGITRFHAVYWPAILLSAGLPLPTHLLVHGYLTANGHKISKSAGNGASPADLAKRFGSDSLRHYLAHHIRSTGDGDFSEDRLIAAHNTELADKLGNLLSRTTALVRRHRGGVVPTPALSDERATRLIDLARRLGPAIHLAIDRFHIHDASRAVWNLIGETNRYLADTAPWRLVADPNAAERFDAVLYTALESLRIAATYLAPFIPKTSARIITQLGLAPDNATDDPARWGGLRPGSRVGGREVLVPKLTGSSLALSG